VFGVQRASATLLVNPKDEKGPAPDIDNSSAAGHSSVMARKLRGQSPWAVDHVLSRGIGRGRIFQEDTDRRRGLRREPLNLLLYRLLKSGGH